MGSGEGWPAGKEAQGEDRFAGAVDGTLGWA